MLDDSLRPANRSIRGHARSGEPARDDTRERTVGDRARRPSVLSVVRLALSAVWLLALAVLIGLAVLTRMTTSFVITGGSMEPDIRLGSLITVEPIAPEALERGDVVSVVSGTGVVVTHRVIRVADLDGATYLELQGDANGSPDLTLVPGAAVVGKVTTVIPYAGFIVSLLTKPSGLMWLLSTLGVLLVAIWLLDELEWSAEEDPRERRTDAPSDGGSPDAVAA